MEWGYLGEFWNAVEEVVLTGTTYTTDWFKSLGNAVAGAIGSLFDGLIHHIFDLFYLAQYLFDQLGGLFEICFIPLTWIFNFVNGFFISAFTTPATPEITWVFSDEVLAVFNAIPYWNVLTFSLGAGISILFIVFVFKHLSNL